MVGPDIVSEGVKESDLREKHLRLMESGIERKLH